MQLTWGVIYIILFAIAELSSSSPGSPNLVVSLFFLLFVLASIWPMLAVQIKRWHDRNKSGWWCLIGLVPFIGGLWVLIECGCLPGVDEGNRFNG
ncbi:MAG: DUF805 domain-containing protein [Methylacidiphilales bacterium]|nr:DUF805 domain-containing protein [Candidatus Methylacidiphilales bacterium]